MLIIIACLLFEFHDLRFQMSHCCPVVFLYHPTEQIQTFGFKVYAEHLLYPLLKTIFALSGPKTTILVNYLLLFAFVIWNQIHALIFFLCFLYSWDMRFVQLMSMNKCLRCGREILR